MLDQVVVGAEVGALGPSSYVSQPVANACFTGHQQIGIGITDQCTLTRFKAQVFAQGMHGSGVGFAGEVFRTPNSGDVSIQPVMAQEGFNASLCVVADHGTDHPGCLQLIQAFPGRWQQ
jgi:hypothetical protein